MSIDSNHNWSHKMAAFSSIVHRLLTIPLTQFNKEFNQIKRIAASNGYNPDVVDRFLKNAQKKKDLKLATTLTAVEKDRTNVIVPLFNEKRVDTRLKSVLKMADVKVVNKNRFQLRSLLGTTKDKTPMAKKSEIYQIDCKDCDLKYIRQTSRPAEVLYG